MEKSDIKTDCSSCVFNNPASKKKETACALNRLVNFEKNNAIITKNKECGFTVNGRFCSTFRTKEWEENKPKNNLLEIVRAEIIVKTDAFIIIDDNNVFNAEELKKTLSSLNNQLLPPNEVVVVLVTKSIKPSFIVSILKEYKNLNWRVDQTKQFFVTNRAIDEAVRKTTAEYYSIFYPGYIVPSEFFADLDEAINERLEQVSFILPDNEAGNGTTISVLTHKRVFGHQPSLISEIDADSDENVVVYSILDKVKYLAEKHKTQCVIKRFNEICSQK